MSTSTLAALAPKTKAMIPKASRGARAPFLSCHISYWLFSSTTQRPGPTLCRRLVLSRVCREGLSRRGIQRILAEDRRRCSSGRRVVSLLWRSVLERRPLLTRKRLGSGGVGGSACTQARHETKARLHEPSKSVGSCDRQLFGAPPVS